MNRTSTSVVVLYSVVIAVGAAANTDVLATRYLAALRERRLDKLVDAYCASRLNDPSLDDATRTQIALDYASHLATQATETADDATRSRLWESARKLLADATAKAGDANQRFLLQLQAASLDLARGQWLRAFAELEGQDSGRSQPARAALREAASALTRLATAVDDAAKDRRGNSPRSNLAELATVVQRRLALAEVEESLTYPAAAPEPRALLESAAVRLERLVRPTEQRTLPFDAALELGVVYRRLARFGEAEQLLDRLQPQSASAEQKDELLAERTETLLDQNKTVEALALLYPALQQRTDPPPRWELLHLQVLLQQAKTLDPADAGKLQASAFAQLRQLEKKHGGVWARRGELLVGRHAMDLVGEAAGQRRRAAQTLVRSGKLAEAAKVYEQAAAAAQAQNQPDEAFALRHEAGRAWREAGQPFAAAAAFERAVGQQPDHPRGPETLLLAIHTMRDAFRAKPTEQAAGKLEALIQLHLQRYSADPTVGEVQLCLGGLRRAQRRFADAVTAFRAVTDERLRPAALLQAGRTYDDWLTPLAGAGSADPLAFQEAVAHLRGLAGPESSARLNTEQQAENGCRLARFLLDPRQDNTEEAIDRLNAVLRLASLPEVWRHAARRYLIYALVLDERIREAEAQAKEQAEAPPAEVLATLQLISTAALVMTDLERKLAGQSMQKLVKALERRQAELPSERRFDAELARALAAIHTAEPQAVAEAQTLLKQLRTQNPNDARVIEAEALALMQQGRLDQAAGQWRTLIAGVRPQSAMWYRAKLQLVICLRRAGQPEQARKIVEVLQVLHPDLGGSTLKARFLDELARLKRL